MLYQYLKINVEYILYYFIVCLTDFSDIDEQFKINNVVSHFINLIYFSCNKSNI